MIQNSMVAVCDILGFSELVRNRPLHEIVDRYLAYLRKALHFSVQQGDWPTGTPTLQELLSQKRVGFAWFSDTFLFYSLEDTEEGYLKVIETVAWLIHATIVFPGMNIRAGLAYGELYVDQNNGIYVGQSLVDAYKLENQQEWSGGALTKSAVDKVPNEVRHVVGQEGLYPWYVVQYDVPVKPMGSTLQTLAIDWTMLLALSPHDKKFFGWSKKNENPPPGTPSDVVTKFLNTKRFHDRVCKFCL